PTGRLCKTLCQTLVFLRNAAMKFSKKSCSRTSLVSRRSFVMTDLTANFRISRWAYPPTTMTAPRAIKDHTGSLRRADQKGCVKENPDHSPVDNVQIRTPARMAP